MSEPQLVSSDPNWHAPSAPPEPVAAAPAALPEIRRPIATGRGTQFNPDLPNKAVEASVTPLAHPTGIEAIDSMTSPVGIASLAAGGYGVARAGLSGGMLAGAKEALSQATPLVKYEAARSTLRALGVPDTVASVVGAALSGYKGGTKAGALSADDKAMLDAIEKRNATIAAREAAAAKPAISPVESAPGGTPPLASPPPVAPPASATVIPGQPVPPTLLPEGTAVPPATVEHYPQKFLNETAIQARRQKVTLSDGDYAVAKGMVDQGATPQQAVQTIAQARSTSAPAPTAKPKLTAEDAKQYLALRTQGKTHQQAVEALQAMKTLGQGLPSSAQVKARVEARNASGRWSEEPQ